MQMVRQELQAKLGDKVKDLSGVKIFTTFDSVAQDAAEKAAVDGIPELKKQLDLNESMPQISGTILFRENNLNQPQAQQAVSYLRNRWSK